MRKVNHTPPGIFHITWVTHNARTSERMIQYRIKKGEVFWLNPDDEIKITEMIRDIVQEKRYKVYAYNICGDHVHMLIEAKEDEISRMMRTIKGKSSQQFKNALQIPSDEPFRLWAQKYHKKLIESEEQFSHVIHYIENNRYKHELSGNPELEKLITEIIGK
jgi:REP element-mobilizing transposase RayT